MSTIDNLAALWLEAKANEEQARAARLDIETAMLAHVASRSEGAVQTVGDACKVTTTYGMTRTVDAAALEAVRSQVPAALYEQAIEYAPKLKLAGLRYLQNNEPDTYAVLAQAITAKPSKPAVKVEALAQEEREAA